PASSPSASSLHPAHPYPPNLTRLLRDRPYPELVSSVYADGHVTDSSARGGPPPLDHPRRGRARPAHGRARRHRREHRAPLRPGRPRVLRRRPAVGPHVVLARLREPPAPRRSALRPRR